MDDIIAVLNWLFLFFNLWVPSLCGREGHPADEGNHGWCAGWSNTFASGILKSFGEFGALYTWIIRHLKKNEIIMKNENFNRVFTNIFHLQSHSNKELVSRENV